jgi:hypothetical protein
VGVDRGMYCLAAWGCAPCDACACVLRPAAAGRAMHCICRAIHWDRPGICCLGNPDRVVNVRLEFMSRVADAKRRSCHSDARCRACVIAGRCRDLAAYRLPLAVNAQKQYYSELVWMSLWCLQHASTMSERWYGWWGTIVCRLVV